MLCMSEMKFIAFLLNVISQFKSNSHQKKSAVRKLVVAFCSHKRKVCKRLEILLTVLQISVHDFELGIVYGIYFIFFVKEAKAMASNYTALRSRFRVTVDGSTVSIYLKQNGALLIRSQIINNADISLLSAYVEDLEKALMKYTKAVSASMNNGINGQMI